MVKKIAITRLESRKARTRAVTEGDSPALKEAHLLAVPNALGTQPTKDELRDILWSFITMEDIKEVVATIMADAKAGKPVAMTQAIKLLGLEGGQQGQQKTLAESLLEKIRDIIALQRIPGAVTSLPVPTQEAKELTSDEFYTSIIEGGVVPGVAVGSEGQSQSGDIQSSGL